MLNNSAQATYLWRMVLPNAKTTRFLKKRSPLDRDCSWQGEGAHLTTEARGGMAVQQRPPHPSPRVQQHHLVKDQHPQLPMPPPPPPPPQEDSSSEEESEEEEPRIEDVVVDPQRNVAEEKGRSVSATPFDKRTGARVELRGNISLLGDLIRYSQEDSHTEQGERRQSLVFSQASARSIQGQRFQAWPVCCLQGRQEALGPRGHQEGH